MAETLKEFTAFDFSFILRPASVLINAIAALGDLRFNPTQRAVIQVGEDGFEITVQSVQSGQKQVREVFGFLCLKESGLEDFQCNKPMRKLVSLESLMPAFYDVSSLDCSNVPMSVYADYDSDEISFELGGPLDGATSDFGSGLPVSIEMQDLEDEYKKFPDVSYGFEAVIPSKTLRSTIMNLLNMPSRNRPKDVTVTLTAATLDMKQDKEVILSTKNESDQHKILMNWKYWESLHKASRMAEKCFMYLVTDPADHIMLRINLGELGDFVYLTRAGFLDVAELHNLGQFHSVLP